MTHLVNQCEDVVQRPRPVEQHIRMHAVYTGGISSAALALILDDINPAIRKCPSHHRKILLPERLQGFKHHLPGLLVGNLHAIVTDHRGVYIIHMQLRNAEHLLAQADVAMHLVKIPVNALDQVVTHFRSDIVGFDRCHERGRILSCLRKEDLLAHLPVVESSPGIFELLIALVEFFK